MNAIQHSNGQDNINVNEISESLTSASSAPAFKTEKKKFSSTGTRHRKFSCSAIRIRLEEHLADPSRRQHRRNQFVSEQIVLVCIPVVPAEKKRSIERVSSWRSPNYVETQVRLRKDWRSVLSRRFSSSIKTTNINTEEIFSVHSTSFFMPRRKHCSYSSLADTSTVKKKNLEAKSDCPNIVPWFSIVKTQKHQLTFPDFTSTILEHPDYWRRRKTMKSSEDSSSSICTTYE